MVRTHAALACILLAGVAGGCLGPATPTTASETTPGPVTDGTPTPLPPPTPTATPVAGYDVHVFDHADAGAPAIEGGIVYDATDITRRFYATVVSTAGEAERFDHGVLRPEASAFVRNTSFVNASLVVVQAFPASSHPDYRVESVRRRGDRLVVAVNDSSKGGTADTTVETVLLRVPGDPPERVRVRTEDGVTFTAGTVVTVTPEPTPTPEPTVALPFTAVEADDDVPARGVRVRNRVDDVVGVWLTVVYHDRPDCRSATPPCGMPARRVELFDRWEKVRPGGTWETGDLVAREGTYTVAVVAELPGADGRRTVRTNATWTVGESGGDAVVTVSSDGVSVETNGTDDG